MKSACFIRAVLGTFIILLFTFSPVLGENEVNFDFKMSYRTIEWLEYIKTDPSEKEIKQYFMDHVAPTDGCQSIIHHWARFTEWDNEKFYQFIMKAMGKIPSDQATVDENGNLTMFGKRQQMWQTALSDPDKLKTDLNSLSEIKLSDTALALAKKYLPKQAFLKNNFYIVLFGGSSAFSVGKENGFDLLQLPHDKSGKIDTDEVIITFAHEIHHSGFYYLNKDIGNNSYLAALFTAEGMPTAFIDKTGKRIEKYKSADDFLFNSIAADWEKHQAELPNLYLKAQTDIKTNLESPEKRSELFHQWMDGIKGPAYVLGSDMFLVIEDNLGTKAAIEVAADYRKLLVTYNRAAQTANDKGDNKFVFDEDLAQKILNDY